MENKPRSKGVKTVIEFSQDKIKLVQSHFKKKSSISCLIYKDDIESSEYGFTNALSTIIKTNRLKIDNLIISLERSLASMRFVKLPSVNEREIRDMAQWQAAKLLPYKIEEIVVYHQTVKTTEDGFSYVLLVIVPKSIVTRFTYVCEALKLQPKGITISSEGLLHWYSQLQSKACDEAVALIEICKSKFELAVIYQNRFIFSRSFTFMQIEDEIEFTKKVIEETKLSIESYQKQMLEPIKEIVLTGNKTWISDFAPLLSDEFSLAVSVIDQFENINLEKDTVNTVIDKNISFASVCGLALSQRHLQINLVLQEVKDRTLYLEKKKQLIKTASLVIVALLVFLGLLGFNLYNKKQIIDSLDSRLAKINPTASEIQNIKNKMAIIKTQLNYENSCLEIFREIHKITPKEIYLSTFIFEEDKEVILKGRAASMSLVFSFVPILNNSLFFKDAQVRYATQRKTQTGELTDFEIFCPLDLSVRKQ